MAPFKRPRAATDDQTAPTPSASQAYPRKKSRVSDVLNPNINDVPESASSSSSSSDSDDNSEIERVQTQTTREIFSRTKDNTAVSSGIIERVDCYNFMCHEHFSLELGPLINFIVGKNGSGKSAVLTALTVCLGGKASITNRGQSLKNFIKEGKESSTVVVRIKNKQDAFQHEHYGDSIIVERHFSRSGTSGFRLKSAAGRIISTRKSDLDSITDYFALQIDNPMNVLSQDMARQFLSSSSTLEKYKFFVKGVQLEQLDQDYRVIEEFIDQLEVKIDLHVEEMKILEQKKKRTNDRLELSDRQESLRRKKKHLLAQNAWSRVEEQERIRDNYDTEIENMTRDISNFENELESLDKEFQEADEKHGAAVRALEEAKSILENVKDGKKEITEKNNECMDERSELKSQKRTIREHLKEVEFRIGETQKNITEENRRLEDLNGGSNVRRLAELEEKKGSAEETRARHLEHSRQLDTMQDDVNKAEEAAKLKRSPVADKRAEIGRAENHAQVLARGRGQREGGFPESMPILLRAIEQERDFAQRPVGPMGQHVRLLKPKWSSVLESSFGGSLSSFVVTSKRDMNILSRIMQRVNCVCSIYIGNATGNMDTSAHEPDPKFDTALRILEIDNDLVRRQLVINHGIEQMLLIENLEEASNVLFDGERPKNVKRCYCIDARDKRRGIHLAYNRAGEPSQSPVTAYTGRPRMKTDIEIQIRLQRDVIESLKRDLGRLEHEQKLAYKNVEECKQRLTRNQRQARELKIETQKAEDLVEELKDAIDRDSIEDGRLDALKSALKEAEEEKQLNERSFEDCINASDQLIDKLKGIKRELASKDAEIKAEEQKVRQVEIEETRVANTRRKALENKNVVSGRVETSRIEKAGTEEKRREQVALIQDYGEKASRVSSRVEIGSEETTRSLENKLERLIKDLERYDREMGAPRDEIATAAADAHAKYELSKQQVQEFKLMLQSFKNTLKNRRDRWEKFRSHISSRARSQFMYLLSERSFKGEIKLDHKSKLLDLIVEPDSTKVGTGRGARTLSGGEKSFSQICLLLALWEAMGSPIRCLDEFDVYMDPVNRKMSIDILMVAARRSVGRQFIFITPGSRSDISLAPDVRVKELAEPERGQRTIVL